MQSDLCLLSVEERTASIGCDASNRISKSLPASPTVGLKNGGTIRLDHFAAKGQTRLNNDFEHRHEWLVTGSKAKGATGDKQWGWFFNLCEE